MVLSALASPFAAALHYVSVSHFEGELVGLLANLRASIAWETASSAISRTRSATNRPAARRLIADGVTVDRIVPDFFARLHVHDQRHFLLTEVHLQQVPHAVGPQVHRVLAPFTVARNGRPRSWPDLRYGIAVRSPF